ncbi:hypothetical protein DPMN_176488 [Dreissena polymorpha]|uniref:Uncharacterized protein n=1 Tax=Dreissena polymorpha TaxID=45954 RepID=A0A9D4EA81_DREPO|nr:hypothetical protein DPMN_176488 [Dreissena polymorpha]
MNNKWPHGGNVFQQTGTIFELVQDIIGTNLLTMFHEDLTINVASTVLTRQISMTHNGRQTIDKKYVCSLTLWLITTRLFTCFHYIHIEKTAPPPAGNVFPPIMTIFELAKNVTSRVFTSFFYYINLRKITPSPGGHAFLTIRTIFELNRHIQKTHVLTKFYEDWTKNVTSRVFTSNCPAPWRPCFSPIWTIFELVRDINETNVLIKFHDDWALNTAPPSGGNSHEDWASNVTSTHELSRGINGTNVLTKFHEDQTINVASGVFTRQMLTTDDARRTKGDHKSSPSARCAQEYKSHGHQPCCYQLPLMNQ